MTIRGIRNNNPGNIETGAPWQGLLKPIKMTAAQLNEERFCVFEAPKWGIRAIARTLITYQDKRQAADGSAIDTVKEIIDRWAPPHENDTTAYQKHVRVQIGLMEGQIVNVHQYHIMKPLVKAIIQHENGQQPYTDAQIDTGLILAGITPPEKPLTQTRTVKGGSMASAGTAGAMATEALLPVLEGAKGQIQALIPYMESAKWVFAVLVVCGIGVMLWARIDDRRKGLR